MRKLVVLLLIGMSCMMIGCANTDAEDVTKQEQGDEQGAQDKKEEQGEEVTRNMEEMLGIDYKLLTYSDMESALREVKEELGIEEEDVGDVTDAITERYGYLNGRNYVEGLVPDDDIDEYTQRQLVTMMASNLWWRSDGNNDIADIIYDIEVFPSTSLITYENYVQYDDLNDKAEPRSVLNGGAPQIVVGDTKGFHDGNNLKVGYPMITEDSLVSSELRENILGVSFAVYIEDDITIADFLDEVDGIEVEVNGQPAVPFKTLTEEEFMENADRYIENGNYASSGVKNKEELEAFFEHELEYGHVYSINENIQNAYDKLEGIESKSDIDFNFNQYMAGYKEFLEQMKQEKILLGGTFRRVYYEIDRKAILGNYEGRGIDYFTEESHELRETPVITVDGVDMNTEAVSISTDTLVSTGEDVYYEE
ncbi:hypothetical protein [Oceanobacillus jeddahense]|uniref:CamS family sex pheromone protein n=1 Tax=Oceanobacillus jeddahense TaxID=1462527 RepID=A0ABY5JPH1_9BACI|nr:hypothetical protein [Oceanobacillus jeddahense]UUI02195.1 hypothetical protein NP439_19450 [Oceanobacillus jeddahense]